MRQSSQTMQPMEITIVGGGIAGMAAAIALAGSGCKVKVLERSAGFDEHGAGLQLGPNGVKALQHLGAWPELEGKTFAPRFLRIMDAMNGECLRSFSFELFATRFGAPYRVAHRRDLLHALLARARSIDTIDLLPGFEATGLSWDSGRPVLILSGGNRMISDAIVGADGIHSVIREALIADGPPVVHPQSIYRALIPRVIAPAVPGDVVLWLYPGGHVVHYPVTAGQDINIVAVVTDGKTEGVRDAECSAAEVAAGFDAMCPELRYVLGLPVNWSRWTPADRLPSKILGTGAATLLGDAAHPMLPYLAQGAVAALEDAVALGNCVASESSIAAAFRQYEALRGAHTSRLQREARAQARLYHWRGWRGELRNGLIKIVPQHCFFSRIAWIYVSNHTSIPDGLSYTPRYRAER
jgi:salicylate hydroxylase